MTQLRSYAPDFVSKATLAYRLDLKPEVIDQYVDRGLLPEPQIIGDAERWLWAEVEERLINRRTGSNRPAIDPYTKGVRDAAEAAPKRRPDSK